MPDPFPSLTLKDGAWEGRDALPSWAGYQSRLGPYTSIDKVDVSDGTVLLSAPPPGDEDEGRPPAPAQVRAYAHLKENETTIARAVWNAVLVYAKALDSDYDVPENLDSEDFKTIVGLGYVHVLPIEKEDFAYIGFEIGCTWDEDHGCGVMTHRGRIVSVGQADDAFEGSVALEDGGREVE